MQAILNFFSNYWVHGLVLSGIVFAANRISSWLDKDGVTVVDAELEKLRAQLHANPVAGQLAASDALVNLIEGYIPELIHGLDSTIQTEISTGKISSLDWKTLGSSLWSKARAEVEAGVVDYMKVSGEKDGEVLAALVAKKFFMKQAALQKGLIVPHN